MRICDTALFSRVKILLEYNIFMRYREMKKILALVLAGLTAASMAAVVSAADSSGAEAVFPQAIMEGASRNAANNSVRTLFFMVNLSVDN